MTVSPAPVCRQKHGLGTALDEQHALLAARNEEGVEFELLHQVDCTFDEFVVRLAVTGNRFELRLVWRDDRGAAVLLEVGAFRVHEHRHARFAADANHRRNVG